VLKALELSHPRDHGPAGAECCYGRRESGRAVNSHKNTWDAHVDLGEAFGTSTQGTSTSETFGTSTSLDQ